MKSPPPGGIPANELNDFETLYRKPCELSRGRLVLREPTSVYHGVTAARLTTLLDAYVAQHALGAVFTAEAGFVLTRNPDTVRAPDVAFVRANRMADVPADQFFEGAPDLAIEVLSPSNRTPDLLQKITQYFAAGCALVWVVDYRTRSVIVHTPGNDPRRLAEHEMLDGASVVPGFRCAVHLLFFP